MRKRNGARPVLVCACLALAMSALIPALVQAQSQSAMYELHLEVPNISEAPSGDRVAVTGSGMFSVHPKSVTATGTFTHTDSAGNLVGSGTWTAIELLAFQPYGCGVVTYPDPDVILPPNVCGGKLKLRVQLSTAVGPLEAILTVFCIIGPKAPASHDDPSGEGVHLNAIGVINFNKILSGMNVYIKTS